MKNLTVQVSGGYPLVGDVILPQNKNSILPILCASLLAKDHVTILNVPKSPDVLKIIEAMEKIGVVVEWKNDNKDLFIITKNINNWIIDSCVADIQSASLFIGPLLVLFGKADVPRAIGCKLGYRGPEGHIDFFKKVGVTCTVTDNRLFFEELLPKKELPLVQSFEEKEERRVSFSKPLVTPTENILIYLSARPQEVWYLDGLAQEPHVQDLVDFLNNIAQQKVIKGHGSSRKIQGTSQYRSGIEFLAGLDHIDAAGWITAAVVTKGEITLRGFYEGTRNQHLVKIVDFFKSFGVVFSRVENDLVVLGKESSFSPDDGVERYSGNSWKIYPGPWPQLPVDALPCFATLALQNKTIGTEVHVINHMYEDGLVYGGKFREMGAEVVENNMMLTIKSIPNGLPGNNIVTAPDVIEGVRAVLLAALSANKGSLVTVRQIDPILRRNPQFLEILESLGAKIEII